MQKMTNWTLRQSQKNKPTVSLLQAAKELSLGRQGVTHYIQKGVLKGFKWAGKWWLYEDDVQALKLARAIMPSKTK